MNWKFEPVAFAAAVKVVLVAAIAFGLKMSAEQLGALIAAVEVVSTFIVRDAVTPVATFNEVD